jgi:hypothetical protein
VLGAHANWQGVVGLTTPRLEWFQGGVFLPGNQRHERRSRCSAEGGRYPPVLRPGVSRRMAHATAPLRLLPRRWAALVRAAPDGEDGCTRSSSTATACMPGSSAAACGSSPAPGLTGLTNTRRLPRPSPGSDIRYVARAGAFLHPGFERRLIRRIRPHPARVLNTRPNFKRLIISPGTLATLSGF